MNTVKIYLKESGSTALLDIDFRMYRNAYQNKLIDIYVPKSILYANQQGTFINAVKTGGVLTSASGEPVTTNAYYADYLRDEVVGGVSYAVYEQKMPKEYTVYVGGQKIVTNVVSVDTNHYVVDATVTDETEGTYYIKSGDNFIQKTLPEDYVEGTIYYKKTPRILQVVTTQEATLTVYASEYLDQEETIDPSQLEIINGRLDQAETDIDGLETRMTSAETTIAEHTEQITQNTEDIEQIKETMSTGEDYIGTMTVTTLPTDAQLNAYVLEQRERASKNGDTVIVIQQIQGGTDKNFKYIYNGTEWTKYEIPPIELSGNGTAGIVKGTYGVGSTNNVLVDIVGGEVKNIYIKNGANYERADLAILNNADDIADIISGEIVVGEADKASKDGSGNDIEDTYLTQNAGATKTYVKGYALPKEFNNILYMTADGYSEDVPVGQGAQFVVTSASVGEHQLAQLTYTYNDVQFELSKKNSYGNTIQVSANRDCNIQLKVTTEMRVNNVWNTLDIELSDETDLTADSIHRFRMGDALMSLSDKAIKVQSGDVLRQTIVVVTNESTSTTFSLYSNSTYPSTFNLNTSSFVQYTQSGELGEQRVYSADGELEDDTIIFELPSATVLHENTEAQFRLNYTGEVANDTELLLELDGEEIRLVTPYNLESESATVEDLAQATRTEDGWIFKGFIEKEGSDFIVRVDVPDMSVINAQSITINGDHVYETLVGDGEPTSATTGGLGQHYIDRLTGKQYYYNGTTWIDENNEIPILQGTLSEPVNMKDLLAQQLSYVKFYLLIDATHTIPSGVHLAQKLTGSTSGPSTVIFYNARYNELQQYLDYSADANTVFTIDVDGYVTDYEIIELGGGEVEVDEATISKNDDGKLQAIGLTDGTDTYTLAQLLALLPRAIS